MRTYTMNDAMDSANDKLDPSVYYGELGCSKNPKRKDFYEILPHWIQISKQNNIEYILAYGSLLGVMWDGDVILFDSDIDVLVDHNYFSILKRLSVKTHVPFEGEFATCNLYLWYVKLLVVTNVLCILWGAW